MMLCERHRGAKETEQEQWMRGGILTREKYSRLLWTKVAMQILFYVI